MTVTTVWIYCHVVCLHLTLCLLSFSHTHTHTQALAASTTTAAKSKRQFHERDASFSSSIQSNDSVFIDTEPSSCLQTSGRLESGELLAQEESPSMGPRNSKVQQIIGELYGDGQELMVFKRRDKRSAKDSGYGSRLNTDDVQSPPVSSSSKYSPNSSASPTKGALDDTLSPVHLSPASNTDGGGGTTLPILPLADSPTRTRRSYLQFYYVGDPIVSPATYNTQSSHNKSSDGLLTPKTGRYPKKPIIPPKRSRGAHQKIVAKSLKPIKSASCSSLDRLSLTPSLEEYASNIAGAKESVDGEPREMGRQQRLLSITHFETLTSDLEKPQCATVVKLLDATPGGLDLSQKEKKRRWHLLSRLLMGKRKQKTVTKSSDPSKEVIMTPAGEATLRRKSRKNRRGRQRKVVSDDFSYKLNFEKADVCLTQLKEVAPAEKMQKKQSSKEEEKKPRERSSFDKNREKQFCLSAEHSPRPSVTQNNPITSSSAELSQSMGGLSDLKRLENQLRKLAQPSQSTTDLDLSQRAMQTMSNVGLRSSHSVDNFLGNTVGAPVAQSTAADGDHLPCEGFLWRVLGRASQRWPALVHIVPIQSNQSGMRGFGVRKGQQVRALYRVSGQVIVETDSNHLACIPYECCRISRKYYGSKSSLVQLSYSQLYTPIPDLPPSTSNRSPLQTSPSKTQHIHMPIEMVAIQDSYDCLPLGEMNVDAGDKLRVLYCDNQRVYAVKQNGEAGLLARSFCRLTRRSEKTYQKWVELTGSPFQADYPMKFNEKPPSFLTNGALLKELGASVTPAKKNSDESAQKGHSKEQLEASPQRVIQKPLPPTPPKKRKVSPLVQNGHKSPQSPSRPLPGIQHTISPVSRTPSLHSTPPSPTKQHSLLSEQRTVKASNSFSTGVGVPGSIFEASRGALAFQSDADIRRRSLWCTGKLMTVVQSYNVMPKIGSPSSPIRKGLRVRVIRSYPDGKTLRVATKTGTQFDIPVGHLCMSRKNSEPSLYELGMNAFGSPILATDSILYGSRTFPGNCPQGKSPNTTPPSASKLPLECGKIMTVIHNFTPTPDNPPMVTIRRGLRVKVLGGKDDQVKVITKTGTTFTIPRSHLRLSHKTSDAAAFSINANVQTESVPPNPPPTFRKQSGEAWVEHFCEDYQRHESPQRACESTHSSPTRSPVKRHIYASSSCNGLAAHSPSQQREQRRSLSVTNCPPVHRGFRVNSTGSQVFELC